MDNIYVGLGVGWGSRRKCHNESFFPWTSSSTRFYHTAYSQFTKSFLCESAQYAALANLLYPLYGDVLYKHVHECAWHDAFSVPSSTTASKMLSAKAVMFRVCVYVRWWGRVKHDKCDIRKARMRCLFCRSSFCAALRHLFVSRTRKRIGDYVEAILDSKGIQFSWHFVTLSNTYKFPVKKLGQQRTFH